MIDGSSLITALDYSRPDILAGEWWRLISGHLVHLNVEHFLVNGLAAALLLVMLPRQHLRWRTAGSSLILLCVLTSLMILILWPSVQWYLGFSGILHGGWLLVAALRRDLWGAGMLGLLLLKLSVEQTAANAPIIVDAIPVASEGHLAGALSGIILVLALAVKAMNAGHTHISGPANSSRVRRVAN